MDGRPVWLVSVSRVRVGKTKATGHWSRAEYRMAERVARLAMKGIGDTKRERAFRMNITFCIHRSLTQAEEEALPTSFFESAGGLAGPPVEVLWSNGIPHSLAAMPCENPLRRVIDPARPDLWVPEGCGACEVCVAREASRSLA